VDLTKNEAKAARTVGGEKLRNRETKKKVSAVDKFKISSCGGETKMKSGSQKGKKTTPN